MLFKLFCSRAIPCSRSSNETCVFFETVPSGPFVAAASFMLQCCLTVATVLLRTFARNFSNIVFFLKILPLKDHELAMSEM